MSDRVRGITIRFDGDTRGLTRAINNVRKESGDLSKELRAIDRELKFDPRNINLLAQKQQVLTNRVRASVGELAHLKEEQKRLAADPSIDKTGAEWRQLEREIIRAERQTRAAAREMVKFGGSAKLNAMSSGLTTVGKKLTGITRNARLAAGAIAGMALFKGFERLKSLDETSTQLETLGYRGKQLEGIMDGVKTSVSGTRFTLQDMAKVASGALGSGVTDDYKLDEYLSRTADLAQLAGIGVQEMGGMMNKAYSRGKVDAELMNQLNDRGIPIYKLLQKELGVTAEELQKMSREGKISFDDLYRATEKYDGLAQDMAMKTLPGAATVITQQFSLMGADFLSGAYEPMKEGVIGILNYMKKLQADGTIKKWGQAIGEAIKYFVEWFKEGEASMDGMSPKAQALANAFGPLIKILGSVVKFFIALPAPMKTALALFTLFGGPLLTFADGLLKIVNMAVGFIKLAKAVGGVMKAFSLLIGINPIVLAIVAGIAALVAIGVVVYKNWDKIKVVLLKIWEGIKAGAVAIFNGIKGYFLFILNIYKTIFKTAFRVIKNYIVTPIKNAVTSVRNWLGNLRIMFNTKLMELRLGVKQRFEQIKDAMLAPIQKARDLIKDMIEKIKGFFKFKFELPHIKLPHFTIHPRGWKLSDLLEGSIPSLGIDWYAKGGIFNSPSVIGVGEKGPEAVLPIDRIEELFPQIDYDRLAQAVAAAVSQVTVTGNVSLDGKQVGRVITPAVNRNMYGQSMLDGRFA